MEAKKKVLVVDDEKDFTQLMKFWLESKGYLVVTAPGGQEAVDIVKKQNPDIIFLDLRMPEMDGAETLKRIRSINSNVPVIIISAYVDDPKIKETNQYHPSGVFYKGRDFEEGLSLIDVALRTHKQLKK